MRHLQIIFLTLTTMVASPVYGQNYGHEKQLLGHRDSYNSADYHVPVYHGIKHHDNGHINNDYGGSHHDVGHHSNVGFGSIHHDNGGIGGIHHGGVHHGGVHHGGVHHGGIHHGKGGHGGIHHGGIHHGGIHHGTGGFGGIDHHDNGVYGGGIDHHKGHTKHGYGDNSLVHGHGGHKHDKHGYGNDYYAPAKYSFGYGVNDPYHGTNFGHAEKRDGKRVEGEYFVDLPDGRKQKVSYYADETGYHPTITYIGKAKYPSGPHHAKSSPHHHSNDHHQAGHY